MGVGAGLYMYVVVLQKFTFAISSLDEFLLYNETLQQTFRSVFSKLFKRRQITYFIPILKKVRGGVEPWWMAHWKARVRLPIRHN